MPNSDRILLSLPEAGEVEQYYALGGKIFEFDFDVAQTIISRNEDDMIIAGQQSGSIELLELYKEGATDTPTFILQDGAELSTPEFIATYDPPITTLDGEDDFTYAQHPAISVSVDEEDLNTPVEVSIQTGYTVDTDVKFGWTEDSGTPGTFTQDVVLDGETVGQFIYDDTTKQVSFVLTKPVAHDSDAAVAIASQLWLRNPDGLLVRPEVEVEVTADLPGAPQFWLGSQASPVGYANILASSASGYWGWSADPDADYSLSFQLLGYEMQTVDLEPGQTTTVQVDGKDFFTITLNPIGTFTIRFHTDYNPSSTSKSEAPLTGPLYFKFTATDASGHNSSSYESTVELCMTETRFGDSGGKVLAHVETEPVFESSLRDGGAGDETEVRIPGQTGGQWQIMFTEAQSDANGGNLAFQAEWVRDDAAGKWVLETANGWLEYRDADSTYSGTTDTKLFYILKAGMDHSTDSGLVGEHLDNIPIVLYSSGLGFGKPFQISVTVPITDDDPEVQFAETVAEINAAHTEGLDVSFAMSGDGPAASNAYEVIFTNLQTGEIQSVSLSAVGSTGTLTFQNSDGSSYDVAVTLVNGKLYLKASQDLIDTVPYNVTLVLTDADGDSAMSSIAVNVKGFDLGDGFSFAVDEADIAANAAVDTVTIPAEWTLDTSTWTENGSGSGIWSKDFTVAGEKVGTLTYDGSTISVTLDNPVDHAADGRDVLNIDHGQITLVSAANADDKVDVPLVVKITDDIPNVNLEAITGEHVSGNAIEGEYSFGYGADGPHATSPITVSIELKDSGLTASADVTVGGPAVTLTDAGGAVIGTFKLDSDTKYTFTPEAGTIDKAVITLTVTDKDGDKVEAATPGEITIISDPDPVTTDTVNESGLPGGTDPAADIVASFPVPEGWEPDPSQWTTLPTGELEYVPTDGTPGKFTYIPGDPADPTDNGTIEFELTDPIKHPDPDTADVSDLTTKIPLQHTGSGVPRDLEVTIPVQDDVPDPALAPTTPGSHPVSGVEFEIDFTPNYGADGKGTEPDKLSFEIVPEGADPADPPITGSVDMPTSSTPVDLEDSDGVIYGTVHIDDSTGKLVFTPAPNMEYEIDMTVTVTDADGDKGTASLGDPLQVTLTPTPDPLELDDPVDESWLQPDGNQYTGGSVTQEIVFDTTEYKVNLDYSGWDKTTDPAKYVLDFGNEGKITYTVATGTLEYELTATHTHPVINDRDDLDVTLSAKVPLTDAYGNHHLVDLKIVITDDIPNPSLEPADPTQTPESGVEYAINFDPKYGADGDGKGDFELVFTIDGGTETTVVLDLTGASVDLELNGTVYGTVTTDTATNQLVFTPAPDLEYSISLWMTALDGDGDRGKGEAPLNLTVGKPIIDPPPVTLDGAVNEALLPNGTAYDSANPTPPSQNLVVDPEFRVDVDHASWATDPVSGIKELQFTYGKVVYDPADGSLVYVLTSPYDHTAQGADLAQGVVEGLKLPVIHIPTGNSYPANLEVNILDDIPEVSITDANGTPDVTLTGDFGLEYGADLAGGTGSFSLVFTDDNGITSTPVTDPVIGTAYDVVIDGVTYGEFTLNADNTYSFKAADPATSGRFEVTLTAIDGDGDEVADSAQITYYPDLDTILEYPDDAFNEAHLPTGTSADPNSLSDVVTLDDGWAPDLTVGGWTPVTGTTEYRLDHSNDAGYFTYDTATPGEVKFTLNNTVDHPAQGIDKLSFDLDMAFVHKYGETKTVTVNLKITDDIPNPTLEPADPTQVPQSGMEYPIDIYPNYGADGHDGGDYKLTFTIDGGTEITVVLDLTGTPVDLVSNSTVYGTASINAGGQLVFKPAPDLEYEVSLWLTATDGDGDEGRGTVPLELKVEPLPLDPDPVTLEGPVNEALLPDGTAYDPATPPSQNLVVDPEYRVDVDHASWVTDPASGTKELQCTYGKVVYDPADGSLVYVLTKPYDHPDPSAADTANVLEGLKLPVIHIVSGNSTTADLEVDIIDDIPAVSISGSDGFAGDELQGDFGIALGADSAKGTGSSSVVFEANGVQSSVTLNPTVSSTINVVINGEFLGEFTLMPNGKYTFVAADPKASGVIKVTLTATDDDGDTTTASDNITYRPKLVDLTFDKDAFNEAYLPDVGSLAGQGNLSEVVALEAGWTPDLTVGGWTLVSGTEYRLEHPNNAGYFTFDTAKPQVLQFTLNDTVDHPAQGIDSRDFTIPMEFVHQHGSTSEVNVNLTIVDDIPKVQADVEDNDLTTTNREVSGDIFVLSGADGSPNETAGLVTFAIEGAYYDELGNFLTSSGLPANVTLDKNGTPQEFNTVSGKLTLWYDTSAAPGEPNVKYTFEALNGLKGYKELFTLSQVDVEGDLDTGVINFIFKDTITTAVDLTVDEAAIVGKGSGQHFLQGNESDSVTIPTALLHDNTTSITWQPPSNAASLLADADGDGRYDQVTWQQQGNNYYGYAEGQLAISLEAEFAGGVFTGTITTTLHQPFKHVAPNASDPTDKAHESMDIELSFIQSNAGGSAPAIGLPVTIVDDEPMRDYQDANMVIDLNGQLSSSGGGAESVYLVLDTACSMSSAEGQKSIAAIKALAQSYVDNGVNAVFTLVGFNCTATTYFNHVSAEQLIKSLSWSSLTRGSYAYFDAGLGEAMRMMEVGRNSPQYDDWHQTMYFFSDGCACKAASTMTTWTSYMASRGDTLDVNVINVDDCTPTAAKYQYLLKVAGGVSNYYHYSNYEVLLDQFVDLVHAEATGNLLGNIAGADGAYLSSITFRGQTHDFERSGSEAEFTYDGVTLVFKQDGSYTVTSGKLTQNIVEDLHLVIKDYDGDKVEATATLVLRDVTRAFDNVGVTEPYGVVDSLVTFGCNLPNSLLTGCYKYTAFTGTLLAHIPDYNTTDLYTCKGYAALLTANKCVDGASILRNIVGSESGVQQLFDKMGLVENTYGSNSIMQFNVTDSGGQIAFNWAFKAGSYKCGTDAAFWFLKDSSGNIVSQGLMAQGNYCTWKDGVMYVDLPNYYDSYTLYIVQQEMGYANRCPDSCLFLKDVVYISDDQLRAVGNVITDPSPDGLVDNFSASAQLAYVEWEDGNGIVHRESFGSSGKLEITTSEGTLYIETNGSYTFVSKAGVTGDVVADFTYYLRDSAGEIVHADLHIRSEDHIINGTDNNDVLAGRTDGDLIQAGGGDDMVNGSNYSEVIYAGSGDDTVNGGGGDDLIHGGRGNDLLYGDAGNDTIFGNDGNDALYGGAGNDLLYGGSGINFLNGGTGADTFAWDKFSIGGQDIIADFNGAEGDRLKFDDLLGNNLSNFKLNEDQTGIMFTIDMDSTAGMASLDKVVEVRFVESDVNFANVVADYDATGNTQLLVDYIDKFIL